MKSDNQRCNSNFDDEARKLFHNDWELDDKILSEGTKAQTPKYFENSQNKIRNISFATTRKIPEIKEIDPLYNESYESFWVKSASKSKIINSKKSINKIALINSSSNIQQLKINESNSGEEFSCPSTLKDEIKSLLRILSKRRYTSILKKNSYRKQSNDSKARDRDILDEEFSKQNPNKIHEAQQFPSNKVNFCKNSEDITVSQILPGLDINNLF